MIRQNIDLFVNIRKTGLSKKYHEKIQKNLLNFEISQVFNRTIKLGCYQLEGVEKKCRNY